MSRLGTQIVGTALAVSVVAFFFALMDGNPSLVTAFVVVSVGLSVWLWRAKRGDQQERPWSVMASVTPSFVARPRQGSTGTVSRALGRVEAREIVLSPWFAVGVSFCAVMVVTFARSYDGGDTWGNIANDLPFLAHPFVGMTVLVGHRLGTRARRDRAVELFASCPTTARTRTLGIFAAAWVPPLALGAFFAAYLSVVAVSTPSIGGTLGEGVALTLVAGMLLGVGGLVLGATLARWVPNPMAPVVAIVLIAVVSPRLSSGAPGEMSNAMLLSTMAYSSDGAPLATPVQAVLHVVWLVAITAATGALALVGTRRDDAISGRKGAAASKTIS